MATPSASRHPSLLKQTATVAAHDQPAVPNHQVAGTAICIPLAGEEGVVAVFARDTSLRTLGMFPSTAHHLAVKLALAVNRLVLDAMAHRQQNAAEDAR